MMRKRHDLSTPESGRAGMLCSLLLILWLLSGCAQTKPLVYASGSYSRLPSEGSIIIVWAAAPAVQASVERWLQDRQLTVMHSTRSELDPHGNHEGPPEALLVEGRRRKAEQVVVVDSIEEASSNRHLVRIHGWSVEEGRDLWSGSAWDRMPADMSAEEQQTNEVTLACHALATAFRLRPGGSSFSMATDPCDPPL